MHLADKIQYGTILGGNSAIHSSSTHSLDGLYRSTSVLLVCILLLGLQQPHATLADHHITNIQITQSLTQADVEKSLHQTQKSFSFSFPSIFLRPKLCFLLFSPFSPKHWLCMVILMGFKGHMVSLFLHVPR